MKNPSLFFLTILTVIASSCKDNTQKNAPEVITVDNTKEINHEIAESEAEFNNPAIEAVFNQYIQIQAALVNTDAIKAAAEAEKLKPLVAKEEVMQAVVAIAASQDIEVQRKNFEALSLSMENLMNGALKSGTLYKQYCPMAFNNKGAFWISSSKDILNPYFGDKMLKCGRVEAEIGKQ